MNFFAKLSLGYLADRIAHVVGWSPIAKLVVISDVEGPAAALVEGFVGTVRSVQGCTMILEPDREVHTARSVRTCLRLTARHEGWTPYSLCFGPIVVVIEAEPMDEVARPAAIGIVKVLRRRDLVSHR